MASPVTKMINASTTTKSKRTSRRSQDLNDLIANYNKLVRLVQVGTIGCPLTDPGTGTGTSSNLTWKNAAFSAVFHGLLRSVASAETAFTATTHDVAASKEAWYVLSVQTNGSTFTITKAADQTIGTQVLPTVPAAELPVAFAQIITGAGGIFDASTDVFAAGTGNIVTLNIYDVTAPKLITNPADVLVSEVQG